MTKKHMLALLSTTVLLTQGAVTFADEVVPVDPTAPSTGVVVPDTSQPQGTDTSETSPVDPTVPSTLPSTDESTVPSETLPDTGSETETTPTEEEPSVPQPEPETPPTDTGEVEVPTTDGGTTSVTPDTSVPTNNPNITADVAHNAGASQVGTTSTVTGQVVQDVTSTHPVQLANGATITDIRDGMVTLATGEKISPEAVGITQNSDGTYTAKTIQGDLVTLPHTGEKATPLLSLVGTELLAVMGLLIVKPWKKVRSHASVFGSRQK